MAKITRVFQKLFASTALSSQTGEFGSLAAGTPVYTADPATIQASSRFLSGWYQALISNVGGVGAPAIQDMNSLFLLAFRQLAYGFQAGVPEYDASTTYFIGSIVNDGTGLLYTSLTDNNTGNTPTVGTNWKLTIPDAVPSGSTFPFAGFAAPTNYFLTDGSEKAIATYPALYAALTLQMSMTLNGSTTVTVADTSKLRAGYAVYGLAGISSGTTIASITNGTTFVLSATATTSTTTTGTFAPWDRAVNPATGSAYAAPAAGNFRLPNTSGMYLRGAGTTNLSIITSLGVWQDDATAKNGLTASAASSSVSGSTGTGTTGTMNSNTTHNHGIAASVATLAQAGSSYGVVGNTSAQLSSTVNIDHTHSIPSLSVTGTATAQTITVGAGDTETRPQSTGMNYIIKI